jgi:hypothetical protein
VKRFKLVLLLSIAATAFINIACKKNSDVPATTSPTAVPEAYKKIYGATDIYVEGNYVVIKSNALPDHKSPYYQGTQWSAKFEAYNGTNPNYMTNPNRIAQASLTFKIPLNPAVATNHASTPMGPIGVSLNGVPFFNQYAAGGSPLTGEINSFDQYYGHPQQQGQYHYHAEPYYLTTTKGKDALLGFLLDGFPVYGPLEKGATITNAQLDAYHGHSAATPDFPGGIYHYHITSADPYLNGNGFYGTPGTISQ